MDKNTFIFQINTVLGYFPHWPLFLVQFFSSLLMTVIVLFKIKSNEVQTDNFCKAFMKLYCHSYTCIVSNNPNITYKVTMQQPKFLTLPVVRIIVRNKETSEQNKPKQYWSERWMLFLFQLPNYFKIFCTILNILWKKLITIISKMLEIETWGWQGSQQSFINVLQNLITSWMITIEGANGRKITLLNV